MEAGSYQGNQPRCERLQCGALRVVKPPGPDEDDDPRGEGAQHRANLPEEAGDGSKDRYSQKAEKHPGSTHDEIPRAAAGHVSPAYVVDGVVVAEGTDHAGTHFE